MKTQKKAATKSFARMGVPTVADRIARMEQSLLKMAAMFEIADLTALDDSKRTGMTLDANEARTFATWLRSAEEDRYWLSCLPAHILQEFAPTDDQRESFERIETAPAAAGGAR